MYKFISEMYLAQFTIFHFVVRKFYVCPIALGTKDLICYKPIRKLDLFVDQVSFLRVCGRLQNSKLPYEYIHPLLLPSNLASKTSSLLIAIIVLHVLVYLLVILSFSSIFLIFILQTNVLINKFYSHIL